MSFGERPIRRLLVSVMPLTSEELIIRTMLREPSGISRVGLLPLTASGSELKRCRPSLSLKTQAREPLTLVEMGGPKPANGGASV